MPFEGVEDTFDDDSLDFDRFHDPFFLWYVQMTEGTAEAQKMSSTPLQSTSWPKASLHILSMPATVQKQIDGINYDIEAFLDFPDIVAQPRVGGDDGVKKERQQDQVLAELAEAPEEIEELKLKQPRETMQTFLEQVRNESELEKDRKNFRLDSFATAVVAAALLVVNKAPRALASTPRVPNLVCQRIHFTDLSECAPGVLCAEPLGAPPGTRFFAYDLPAGAVLCPDTGNVTVPETKHGRARFSVFAESPADASGAPGYMQSVDVRQQEPEARHESLSVTAQQAAGTALGVFFTYGVYWLVTQGD
jgi:hypothetical protein